MLAGWLTHPTIGWAVAAAVVALVGVASAAVATRARVVSVLAVAAALVAAALAVSASRRIDRVERAWTAPGTGVREMLISRAGAQLQHSLAGAVQNARALATLALTVTDTSRAAAVSHLSAAVAGAEPERGVVVDEPDGTPWAWGGRHRLPPDSSRAELSARITPFYVVLEARRQGPNGREASADVLLDADSAVPDREGSLAARFARATNVALRFYAPGRAPFVSDVFDYCLPACSDTAAHPDTLFSVRLVPPTQGSYKLDVLRTSGQRVALLLVFLVVATLVGGMPAARFAALAAGVLTAVFTPLGTRLGAGSLFSPARFFAEELGPFSASVGALMLTAVLAIVVAVVLWRRRGARTPLTIGVAAVLLAVAPRGLQLLADDITPPAAGISLGLWVEWEIGLTLAMAALLLLVAALVRGRERRTPVGWSLFALAWALGTAVLGLAIWQAPVGWPAWYPYVWLPAFVLATLPGRPLRVATSIGLVAGAAAAMVTWNGAIHGRLALAERDAAAIRQPKDPVIVGLLERFATRLAAESPPTSEADLYARWTRSALEADGYPATLATWGHHGAPGASLALAKLELPSALLQAMARSAVASGEPRVESIAGVPSTLYVLTVPFPDSTAVTVGVGPRSRLIGPVRVARFLRGEPSLPAPYTIALSEPVLGAPIPPVGHVVWRRDGWRVRGDERLDLPGGVRHLHVSVDLGGVGPIVIRGLLIVVLDGALLAVLWLLGDALVAGVRLPPELRSTLAFGSYRARLGAALAVFFVAPTVAFAIWTASRLSGEAERSRDLIIQQTLQDAAGRVREFTQIPRALADALLGEDASSLDADLVVYNRGVLLQASSPVLVQLGLLDRYLPADAFEALTVGDEIESTVNERIAGRPTRVGYRSLGLPAGRAAVLAAPRLVDDTELFHGEQDLVFGLILATLVGLAAAAGLATLAVRALSRPVQALRDAARRVGRGEPPAPFAAATSEFVPVMEAFERMARDVADGRTALEAQRERTAAVLRNVATGVIALDPAFHVVTSNLRAEELLGREIWAGDAVMDETRGEWDPVWAWVRAVADGADSGEAREFSIGDRQIRTQITALTGAGGGWVLTLDDTTELSRAVRVLAWGELARQVAHQIKNPLTPIRLGIQHLTRAYARPREDFSEVLGRTSRQMLAEIERLDAIARAFSRFGAPPAELAPLAPVEVAGIARDTAALYSLGDEGRVAVEGDVSATGLARRDELKEVLINVIENAHAADATSVTITVAALPAGGARIVIVDDGRGVPPEHLARVFEPQFSTTTSGSGLGLTICRRLVESWGGTIALESAPDGGTTVTIALAGGA